jgi:type II secretion system protein G
MKLNQNGRRGFTLVEIMIVVAIIGLLAAIAIPNFVNARNKAQASACVRNMQQIAGAIDLFALENNKADGDPVTANDVKTYIKGSEVPKCPAGNKDYVLGGTVNATPSVTCVNAASSPQHKIGS